jgi:hypothetical protein
MPHQQGISGAQMGKASLPREVRVFMEEGPFETGFNREIGKGCVP